CLMPRSRRSAKRRPSSIFSSISGEASAGGGGGVREVPTAITRLLVYGKSGPTAFSAATAFRGGGRPAEVSDQEGKPPQGQDDGRDLGLVRVGRDEEVEPPPQPAREVRLQEGWERSCSEPLPALRDGQKRDCHPGDRPPGDVAGRKQCARGKLTLR